MAARNTGLPDWFLLGLTLLLSAMVVLAAWTVAMWHRPPAPNAAIVEVEVPRGAGLRVAAGRLEAAGLVVNDRLFEWLARTLGDNRAIQFGTYAFRRGEGWGSLLERMKRGDVLTVRIPIPEGMPSIMVAERLNAVERLRGEVDVPAEGSVLPATYEAKVGEERAALLARMQAGMTAELDRLWAGRSDQVAVQTKEEAVILASIVEKETARPDERRRIAGLYSNRLRTGMPLQADPTVIYPITRGKPLQRRIRQSELQADNGYNTYRRAGLPAGPITNPGRESLAAVLDPEAHNYLYMVADGSGGHAFAETYAEHQRNVARWRQYRHEAGI